MFDTNAYMTQRDFNNVAQKDLFRAVWVAKHMGITESVVKAWTSAVLAVLKK